MRLIRAVLMAGLGIGLGLVSPPVEAADSEVSTTLLPVRHASVDGDKEKFRAHHWMKEGFVGGIREFSAKYSLPNGVEFAGEGHALIDQNDLGSKFLLKKEGLGSVQLDFSEFRKYYDNTGGTFHRFTTLGTNSTSKELALDVGKLGVETELAIEGLPLLSFLYEREFKDGAKSRLSWVDVTEVGETRKIGPSWQDVDEIVDIFALGAHHELAGFALSAEQKWEFVRSELFREERSLSTNTTAATASERKIRRQTQKPEADLMTTTLGAKRHFLNEKVFFSSGYHFVHMDNREFESLRELNESGAFTNFSNPKQQINARADNDYDAHTWVGTIAVKLFPWLGLDAKLKSEIVRQESNSLYPTDAVPSSSGGSTPNGVIDRTDVSLNDNRAVRWGEGLALRFKGIPRTALYAEAELEQSRIRLREDRKSLDGPDTGDGTSAGEVFNRRTLTHVDRGTFTLGGQSAPWSFLNLTAHARHRRYNNDYDDQQETDSTGTTARSAFFDGQRTETNEVATRATWKPCRWFRPSLRYQLKDEDYSTRAENEGIVKTGLLSHIYTFDLTLQPVKDLLTTLAFSRQAATTSTPARLSSSGYTPAFHADVTTWLASADYTVRPDLTLTGTFLHSATDNFNDFASIGGVPLGSEHNRWETSAGLKWAPQEDFSVEAEYAFYNYRPNALAEVGDYDAHVVWLEVSKKL